MDKLWQYDEYNPQIGGVPIDKTYKEQFIVSDVSPGNDYTEVVSQEIKQEYISDNQEDFKDYKIFDLVNTNIKNKNVTDVDYKSELKTDVKLHSMHTFSNDGFSTKTEFYYGFVDSQNKGAKILEVDEVYITHVDDTAKVPAARRVTNRTKTRRWYKNNNSLDDLNTKVTTKIYDTMNKQNKEGKRRRDNIVNILVGHTAMGGILSGVFPDEDTATDKLLEIMEFYNGAISSYLKSGKGRLFDDLLNDAEVNHVWIDTVVVDTAQTQAMIPFMIGMTLRAYIISKLKGEII